eukprot:m.253240 g.253240  ORF g.253240 m.253240 type:complete len:71 (+) comp15929_c1_seq1:8860-9072(+)
MCWAGVWTNGLDLCTGSRGFLFLPALIESKTFSRNVPIESELLDTVNENQFVQVLAFPVAVAPSLCLFTI